MQPTGQTPRPTYRLDPARFAEVMTRFHYRSQLDLCRSRDIPHRTLQAALKGDHDLKGQTIRQLLDAFPGVSFEYLFVKTEDAA